MGVRCTTAHLYSLTLALISSVHACRRLFAKVRLTEVEFLNRFQRQLNGVWAKPIKGMTDA
jgi:hypothetical protein